MNKFEFHVGLGSEHSTDGLMARLCALSGGCTVSQSTGAWVNDGGELELEPVATVMVVTDSDDTAPYLDILHEHFPNEKEIMVTQTVLESVDFSTAAEGTPTDD